ncbi:MotA/TolQ/ExbB proton channel family protein [Desulfonema magnum]|uniref:MotA/TolQ/ExbB proton channel domain-containing protein n=1 Tax=Desulfonema magnum TaxID=45655 RepID=A0A975BIR4_9BACT|nr:MotA/TolQ/ExbB proton channel family protein [Desulfonema magnum]QTA85884.1 MotA/TolQ/ExbB proton channel domain-containing protein [Desulfonema magnum]
MDFFNLSNFDSQFRAAAEYLNQGGYVIYPLIGVSVWMWYLIIKKLCAIAHWRKQMRRVSSSRSVSERTGIHGVYKILTECEGPEHFDPDFDKKIMDSLVQRRQNELESHIQTIFVLASVAPLLGLLGTVTGMISTFEAISRFGTANARAFAAGISEALVTTQMGLIVAVPGLFMGHMIRKRTDNIQLRMERWKLRIENYELRIEN